jgi:hypothetical protein
MHSNTNGHADETAKDPMPALRGVGLLDLTIREVLAMRNAQGAWGAVPIRRNQLAEWDAYFEAPASDEVALFDPL